jgi:hypothetical protein
MANQMRGEAAIGDHKLVVDFNGFCSLEIITGLKTEHLIARMEKGLGFAELRTWVRVFIDKPMSDEDVGDFIGELTPEPVLQALATAITGFFAPAKKEKGENPLKAA